MEWILYRLISIIRYFKDTRNYRFLWQKLTRGFSDKDTWNLEHTIAKFVFPRLIRFKEIGKCCPMNLTDEEWEIKLNDMIFAMKYAANQFKNKEFYKDEEYRVFNERIDRGTKFFGEYFFDLWW